MYLLLRGEFDIADRDAAGNPKALQAMGETPDFEIMVEEERAENFATGGAFNEKDLSVTMQVMVKAMMKTKEATAANLSLAVFGTQTEQASRDIADVAFPVGIADGETHFIPGRPVNVSALVITQTGAGGALVAGDDYIADLVHGTVKFLDVAGKTQPFKAGFTEGASESVAVMTKVTPEKFLLFRGINIADNEKPVIVEAYRVRFSPAKKIPVKMGDGKNVSDFEFDVELLADPTKPRDTVLGRYGRIRYL